MSDAVQGEIFRGLKSQLGWKKVEVISNAQRSSVQEKVVIIEIDLVRVQSRPDIPEV